MDLKRVVVEKDGRVEATWALERDQVAMLIDYAISDLIARGVASISDISQEELEKLKTQAQAGATEDMFPNPEISKLN